MSDIKYSDKGVTYPKGFLVAATNAGIKNNRDDMAMIVSEVPAECAIVVTSNKVKAAPVLWDKEITDNKAPKKAVVVNVGSANACTGEEGYQNSKKTAEQAAALIGCKPEEVLVSSTGVIGVQLDMDKISSGVDTLFQNLTNDSETAKKASYAILTTDLVPKRASAEFFIDDKKVRIGAMAKGSGMIRPNMATMLSFACTDVNIEQSVLQEALSKITQDTYNMISVDGDMSTNDTAIVLANGLAENSCITDLESKEGQLFYEALLEVEKTLAKAIVRDGEGATKFIEVRVHNAANNKEARNIAKDVCESSLVKTAIFGEDANWGRVLSTIGAADATVDEKKIELNFFNDLGNLELFKHGKPVDFSEEEASRILANNEIIIDINMNEGSGEATGWGCDLTYDYVKINGDYRT